MLDSDHAWPKPVHGALWLPETRIISCPVAPHISCHLQPAGEGRKHILSSWFSCRAHICWPVQSNILQIMPTIGKDGEIKFRFDFCLLIGFLGLTASLAHTIVNINLRDTEYNLCEHVCCTLEHNDPTRTYCLIAWTRSTMFSLPQVLQAQCSVSLKCKVNHTCLATSQCQQGNLTILLPTFGQIVWFNCKNCTTWWLFKKNLVRPLLYGTVLLYRVYFVLIAFVSCLERQEWRYIRNNFPNPPDVCNMVECVGVLLQSGGGGVLSERRRASPSLPLSSSEPGEFSFSLVPLKDYSRSRISAQILASWVSH